MSPDHEPFSLSITLKQIIQNKKTKYWFILIFIIFEVSFLLILWVCAIHSFHMYQIIIKPSNLRITSKGFAYPLYELYITFHSTTKYTT